MAAKKKTSKSRKTTKKSTKKELPVDLKKATPPKMNTRWILTGLVVLALALLAYRLAPWLFPATVNNKPVTRWEVYNRMELAYGAQTLDQIVNEKIVEEAIRQSGVEVSQEEIQAEISNYEQQFEGLGGLDQALSERGLERSELIAQIRNDLAIREILKDKIEPTEEAIQAEFDENADTVYEGKELEEVREDITEALRQENLRDAFLEWFAEVKENIEVRRFNSL